MAEYTNDLRLKEIATGDESGTWGTSTNTNLELIAEAFSYSTVATFDTDADKTETIADGSTDPYRSIYVKVTSGVSLTATRTLTIAPNTVSKIFMIENATSGSQSIAISQGSGADVTIPNGDVKVIYTDGAGAGAAVVDAFASLNVGDLTATNIAGTLTTAAQTNITSVGALNGGSITSGFGSIDVGSSAITTTGTVTGGTLAGTLSTAAQPNITSLGTLTTLTVDDITINGSTISDAGDLTLDVGGDLTLDADGGDIFFADAGTTYGKFSNASSSLQIKSEVSDADIIFKGNDGGSVIEAMRIDMSAGGNVGIGTDSPDTLLEVEGTGSTPLFLSRQQSTAGVGVGLGFRQYDSTNALHNYASIFGVIEDNTSGAEDGSLTFHTSLSGSLSERMRIDENGNVGIGTDNPNEILEVSQNQNPHIRFNNEDTSVVANDIFGTLEWYTNDGSSSGTGIAAEIRAYADVDFIGSTRSTNIDFLTASGTTAPTTRMTIHHDGNVGIGTDTPSVKLEVNDAIQITDTSGDPFLKLATSEREYVVRIDNSDSDKFQIRDVTGAATRVTLDTSGKVGIGIDSPSYTLDVEDSNDGHLAEFRGAGTNAGGRSIRIGAGNADVPELPTYQPYIYASGSDAASHSLALVSEGGTSATGGIDFYTGAVSAGTAHRMRINRIGNVGINTTDPSQMLHLANTGGSTILELQRTNTNVSGAVGVIQFNAIDDHAVAAIRALADGDDEGAHLTFNTTTAASANSYFTSTTERMRIESEGNVGIGTDNPAKKLHVAFDESSTTSFDDGIVINNTNTGTGTLAPILFSTDSGNRIRSAIAHVDTSTYGAGDLAFYLDSDGQTSGSVLATSDEKMRITRGGVILGGTTSTTIGILGDANALGVAGNSGAANPLVVFAETDSTVEASSCILELSYSADTSFSTAYYALFSDSGGTQGTISGTGAGTVAYNTSSDERIKENIVDTGSQLETIKQIQVRDFNYIGKDTTTTGMIAQELNAIIPNVVVEGGDDATKHPWGIDYGKLTPYLIKAIQEQQEQIESLKSEIELLKGGN